MTILTADRRDQPIYKARRRRILNRATYVISSACEPLEAELLEEPAVLARLERAVVLLLEDLLDLLARRLPRRRVRLAAADEVRRHNRFQLHLQRIPRRHQVRVVDHLDERLHLAALRNLLLGHGFGDLERVLLHASNKAVAVRPVRSALVKRLDDNGLLSSHPTVEQQHDLAGLQELR